MRRSPSLALRSLVGAARRLVFADAKPQVESNLAEAALGTRGVHDGVVASAAARPGLGKLIAFMIGIRGRCGIWGWRPPTFGRGGSSGKRRVRFPPRQGHVRVGRAVCAYGYPSGSPGKQDNSPSDDRRRSSRSRATGDAAKSTASPHGYRSPHCLSLCAPVSIPGRRIASSHAPGARRARACGRIAGDLDARPTCGRGGDGATASRRPQRMHALAHPWARCSTRTRHDQRCADRRTFSRSQSRGRRQDARLSACWPSTTRASILQRFVLERAPPRRAHRVRALGVGANAAPLADMAALDHSDSQPRSSIARGAEVPQCVGELYDGLKP